MLVMTPPKLVLVPVMVVPLVVMKFTGATPVLVMVPPELAAPW